MTNDFTKDQDNEIVDDDSFWAVMFARTKEFALQHALERHSDSDASDEQIIATARVFESFLNGDSDKKSTEQLKN